MHLCDGTDVVVRPLRGVLIQQARVRLKLLLHLLHHLHRRSSDSLHGHGAEPVGEHGSDQQEGERQGLQDVDAARDAETGHKGAVQGLEAA